MSEGYEHGLAHIEALLADVDLRGYYLLYAAHADILRRMGRSAQAGRSYERAIALVTNAAERRFFERRLSEVSADRS
jgi:RNA polymerase sigma-70 factor (ECF subfamily)